MAWAVGSHGQSERRVMDVFARGERTPCSRPRAVPSCSDRSAGPCSAMPPEGGRLTAPMPAAALPGAAGCRWRRRASPGGMEAMKMELPIAAPRPAWSPSCHFAVGDRVSEGQELLAMQAISLAGATWGGPASPAVRRAATVPATSDSGRVSCRLEAQTNQKTCHVAHMSRSDVGPATALQAERGPAGRHRCQVELVHRLQTAGLHRDRLTSRQP